MIDHEIKVVLRGALQAAYPKLKVPEITVTHPDNEAFGDFSTSLPMSLARELKQSPMAIAEAIVAHVSEHPAIANVKAVAPGYINIMLTLEYFYGILARAQTGTLALSKPEQAERIIFEYGQPNTHKVAHIGHLFSYCYGESCSRLLESIGNTVIRANYQGDVGPHVAKCLWAYLKKDQPDPATLLARVAYLQECYQEGSAAYDDDPAAQHEIDELNRRIYTKDAEIMPIWEKTRQWSLAAYREFEERLGIHYDRYYLESETYDPGQRIVREHVPAVFEEDQGAVIFRGEKYGLHTRVFISSRGTPTYEAKDVGLVTLKRKEFDAHRIIVETGNDQAEYWRVVKQAIELIYPELKGVIHTLHHGMINLTTGKMSSRTGNILTAFSLVEMVKERVLVKLNEVGEVAEADRDAVAEIIAQGAIKYSFLKTSPGKNIAFDLETSISEQGNSGPYLQYTYARCKSVLAKAQAAAEAGTIIRNEHVDWTSGSAYTPTEAELGILRWLARYAETVETAATHYATHTLCNYLYELAQRYSSFYNDTPILKADAGALEFRLSITEAVATTLKTGLDLLGIQVSERI